jgi:ferredoxin-nitrite reductase
MPAPNIEAIKTARDGLDVLPDIYHYAEPGFEAIPPDDLERMKWYGLFHRKTTPGFFMLRLRMPNGALTSTQLRTIGEVANRYGRGAIDLTTRQNIQLRWIRIEDVPAIFELLDAAGVGHMQTGLDNVRNVTGCPIAGLDPREVIDASAIAREIDETVLGRKEFSNLPRKFNIAVSGCRDDCSLSQTHDLGFTPATRDGLTGFNVRAGGSLGGRGSKLAINLDVFVLPGQVSSLCRAALSIFRDEGARDNRQQARLKFLIEERGLARFRNALEARFGCCLLGAGCDEVGDFGGDHLGVRDQRQPGLCYVGCLVPVGRTCGDEMIDFARIADCYGSGDVRLTNDQNILLVNVPEARLDALLDEPLLRRLTPFPAASRRRLVSCTGSDFCHYALGDTKGQALDVAAGLEALMPAMEPLRMHWSGCPHACGQHRIADIGFLATKVRIDGVIVDSADVYLGGRLGKDPRLAERVLENVPLTELPARVKRLLEAGAEPIWMTEQLVSAAAD